MIVIIIGLVIIASLITVYSYGRFAKQVKGQASYYLPIQNAETLLDRALVPELLKHPNESSLMLLTSNLDAFAIRAKSAREAGRSLDLQYYIWNDDLTGQLLALEILEAAERGVRVRILLDDMNAPKIKSWMAKLNTHPNIIIRLFNPTRCRHSSLIRGIEMLLRFISVNRRMHNKAWIADNRIAIVGGRNIGNEYFDAAPYRNFFDIDLLIGGIAVSESSTIFDQFWNSDAALPLESLIKAEPSSLASLKNEIILIRQTISAQPYLDKLRKTPSVRAIFTKEWPLYWSKKVHVISDPADKVFKKSSSQWLLNQLMPILSTAKQTVKITSPYFVPSKQGMQLFKQLRHQDVDIDILTNSLAATDVIMAHGGYVPYRQPLLKHGVHLFEIKPFTKPDSTFIGSRGASLHTKAFLVDNKIGFVGSFNFDPRSANLNTEMGILFEDPTVASALQKEFELRSGLQFSYQLQLKKQGICWYDSDEVNRTKIWTHDPESKWWQRLLTKIIGWLPIRSQL